MSSIDLQVPFDDVVYAEGPDLDRLDVAALARCARPGRWNPTGVPTGYLAGDPGVLFAEIGAHLPAQDEPVASVVWRVHLRLDRALDLREPYVRYKLGLPDDLDWLVDVRRCRRLAAKLRGDGDIDGLIVPSAAFGGERGRWNAVVFPERLASPVDRHLLEMGRLDERRLTSLTRRVRREVAPSPAPVARRVPAHLTPRRPSTLGGFAMAGRGDLAR